MSDDGGPREPWPGWDELDGIGCAFERETIERLTIAGPMARSKDVMSMLHDDGWHLLRTGPYTDKDIYPRCNPDRFLFIAEKAR